MSLLEGIEQAITYRQNYVRCYCPNCKKLATMVKYKDRFYMCPICDTDYDYTGGNVEPTVIDLINYNREKLGQ